MNDDEPTQTDSKTDNYRDGQGRFTRGNPGGPGNPGIGELAKCRARFAQSIRADDIDSALSVIRQILETGKDSDRLQAIRELLNRSLGLPAASDVLERLEKLEILLEKNNVG